MRSPSCGKKSISLWDIMEEVEIGRVGTGLFVETMTWCAVSWLEMD